MVLIGAVCLSEIGQVMQKAPQEHFKIAVIDDHQLFLDGVKLLINDMTLQAEVSGFQDPQKFLDTFKDGQKFDLILCDLIMKAINGIDVAAFIRARDPSVPVLMLSGITASDPTARLRDIGASGFVHKSSGYDELSNAIVALLAGESYFPGCALENQEATGDHDPAAPNLWGRHMDVLNLLASGATNKQISATLKISENTVKTYMRQLFRELDANTRTACVHKAQVLGLI